MILFRKRLCGPAPAWVLGLGATALCLGPLSTSADGAATGAPGPGTPGGADAASPAAADAGVRRSPTEGLSREYVNACQRGNAQYASHDFGSAIATYRAAISRAPHASLGYYLLGEAQLAAGSLADAEASWGLALSESARDPSMHARTLFVLADLKERQKMWDEARAAWQAYRDWLTRFPAAGGFPSSAQARSEAIERMTQQESAYAVVRQRIQETAEGGVFSTVPGEPVTP
jgi:TolA-binding protein